FGNRMVVSQGGAVVTDRLGSVRVGGNGGAMSYLPYGVEQTSTPNGQTKFGTYLRDGNSSTLGADYADQRYYNPWFGRFNTPDPGGIKTASPANPTSWNRYGYVNGDPVNFHDPTGRIEEDPNLEAPDDWPDWGGGGGGGCFVNP